MEAKEKIESEACSEFIAHLREEKLKQQDRRASYVRLKFAFVIGLFSAAATLTKLEPEDGMFYVYGLLYIAPLVAVLFDFYILGGDFAVKRIRMFLNEQDSAGNGEKVWDRFLSKCPKEFMSLNRLWVTNFIFLASAVPIAIHLNNSDAIPTEWGVYTIWIVILVGLGGYLVSIERNIKKVFYNNRVNSDEISKKKIETSD